MEEETYNRFVEDLEIGEINVKASRTEAEVPYLNYEECTTRIDFGVADYQPHPDDETRFWAFTATEVTFELDGEQVGAVLVEHVVNYQSSVEITDEIFEVFADGNLQFHVWPFIREFVQDATRRMGWPAYPLPTFVREQDERAEQDDYGSADAVDDE